LQLKILKRQSFQFKDVIFALFLGKLKQLDHVIKMHSPQKVTLLKQLVIEQNPGGWGSLTTVLLYHGVGMTFVCKVIGIVLALTCF